MTGSPPKNSVERGRPLAALLDCPRGVAATAAGDVRCNALYPRPSARRFASSYALALVLALSSGAALSQAQISLKSDYEAGVRIHETGNIRMAVTCFEQGVAKDDAKSMFALGTYYRFDEGVSKDFAKARELFQQASTRGSPEANAMLGIIYREGQGVPIDAARRLPLQEGFTGLLR